ncbi:hypothetical protein D3C86_748560 [compost metagenome]|jgi:hypothetical protein
MIEKRKKRKKIFYVPGMISLVLIPLICMVYFCTTDAFVEKGCIDVSFPSDSLMIKQFLSVERKYKVYSFNSSEISESADLSNLQLGLRKMKRENDTINGIKIHLGNNMDYEVYVRILDILSIEQMPNYLQYNDDFFVLMMPKPRTDKSLKKVKFFVCGSTDVTAYNWLKEKQEAERKYVLSLYRKNWILFLSYFGLVLLNIFVLVKFNKNKKYNQK